MKRGKKSGQRPQLDEQPCKQTLLDVKKKKRKKKPTSQHLSDYNRAGEFNKEIQFLIMYLNSEIKTLLNIHKLFYVINNLGQLNEETFT